jgi:hypothetical protein
MGMKPYLQSLLLNWLRGTAMPAPPSLWLSLHGVIPATPLNQLMDRSAVPPSSLGTPRPASGAPLPQIPWVPGNGEVLELANTVQIRTVVLPESLTFASFGLWDAPTGGNMLMNGVLQELVPGQAGDRLSFQAGCLLFRAVAP